MEPSCEQVDPLSLQDSREVPEIPQPLLTYTPWQAYALQPPHRGCGRAPCEEFGTAISNAEAKSSRVIRSFMEISLLSTTSHNTHL